MIYTVKQCQKSNPKLERKLAIQINITSSTILQINPELLPSPFLTCANADAITRFRCGSHHLPIETLRWGRVPRENRLCPKCHVLGDEYHFIFHCVEFPGYFENCNNDLSMIWKGNNVFKYFNKISQTDYLKNF